MLVTVTRCPHCRASVRPGAPWCTLCHADLRPAPEPLPAPAAPRVDPLTAPAVALGLPPRTGSPTAEQPASGLPPTEPSTAQPPVSAGPGEATWPCTTCGARNAFTADACTACGAGFLAGLRDSEGPLLEIPGVGDLTRMSRVQRMLLAFGVVLAVIALVALLGLLS